MPNLVKEKQKKIKNVSKLVSHIIRKIKLN